MLGGPHSRDNSGLMSRVTTTTTTTATATARAEGEGNPLEADSFVLKRFLCHH